MARARASGRGERRAEPESIPKPLCRKGASPTERSGVGASDFGITYPNIRSSNFFLCYNCADAPTQKKIRIWAKIKFNSLMYVMNEFYRSRIFGVIGCLRKNYCL